MMVATMHNESIIFRIPKKMLVYYCYILDICPPLKTVNEGSVVQVGTESGAVGTYKCNVGFELIRSTKRTCQTDGKWSGQEPECRSKLVDNSEKKSVLNAINEYDKYSFIMSIYEIYVICYCFACNYVIIYSQTYKARHRTLTT